MSPRTGGAAGLLALLLAGGAAPRALAAEDETTAGDRSAAAGSEEAPVLGWPSRAVTYRGFLEGNGGPFTRGTVTLSPDAVVSRTRRLFREESGNEWHAPISTYRSAIGLFRGRIEFGLVDGGLLVLVMPRPDARALASTLAKASSRPLPEPDAPPPPAPPRRPKFTTTTTVSEP